MTTRQWINVFRKSIASYSHAAASDATVPEASRPAAVEQFQRLFGGALDALEADPSLEEVDGFATAPLNCSTLCRLRDEALARAGFGDVFKSLKARENDLAVALLPAVLRELDAKGDDEAARLELALRGVFAGNGACRAHVCLCLCLCCACCVGWGVNEIETRGGGVAARVSCVCGARPRTIKRLLPSIHPSIPKPPPHAVFDMGCAETAQRAETAGEGGAAGDFAATRDSLLPRPWAVDDLDAFVARLAAGRHRKALLFVDNAGADVVLGMLPLARELIRRGTEVVLAANERPSINDVTAAELRPLIARAAEADPLLSRAVAERSLRVASSGNDLGVIDLRRCGREVCEEAEAGAGGGGADLVILEGMGRGIETNLRAEFKCDAAKLGMIKHPEVAALLGGRMYEPLCKFDAAEGRG